MIIRSGKKKLGNLALILALSFYYAVGVLWTGEIMTASQTRYFWALSVLSVILIYIINSKGKIPSAKNGLNKLHICLALFILFALASVLWAANETRAYSRGSFVLKIIISMGIISWLMNSTGDTRSILKSIEYGGDFSIIYIILSNGVSRMISMFRSGSRLTYTGINSNGIGIVAAFSIIIAVYFIRKEGIKLTSLLMAPCAFIVILSVSKKAIFATIFGIILMLVFDNLDDKKLLNNLLRIVGIIIGSCVILYFLLRLPFLFSIQTRIYAMLEGVFKGVRASGIDTSTLERIHLNEAGYYIIRNHPILGVGLDNARYYNTYGVYLHNNYLELFADLGIVGLVLYYMIYILCGSRFIKYRDFNDKEFNICATLLILILILDIGKVSYYDLETYYFIVLFYMESCLIRKKWMVSGCNISISRINVKAE